MAQNVRAELLTAAANTNQGEEEGEVDEATSTQPKSKRDEILGNILEKYMPKNIKTKR